MADSKPAIASGTIWGGLLAFVPLIAQAYDAFVKSGVVLPPRVAAIVAAVGGALAILRRVTNKDTKPIVGVVSGQNS